MRYGSVTSVFVLLIFFAPNVMAQLGPGCGPANIKFDVKTEKARDIAATREPGKAVVFFLQDDFNFSSRPRPTTRFGLDGSWVGATHSNSYFYVLVDPGEHRICASWEPMFKLSFVPMRTTAAAHLSAEAGKSYYFRARDITITTNPFGKGEVISRAEVVLESVNSDEAQVLMHSFRFSSSHPKK